MHPIVTAVALFLVATLPAVSFATTDQVTAEAIREQVVSYEQKAHPPFTIIGKDASGRVVWTSSSEGTWGLHHDVEGRLSELVDSEGNRIVIEQNETGCVTAKRFDRAAESSWKEIYSCDGEGKPVIEWIDSGSSSLGDPSHQLAKLGIELDEQQITATVSTGTTPDGTIQTTTGPFATVRTWTSSGKGAVLVRETTEVAGIQMNVESARSEDGALVVTDDWGGWRRETYDQGGLKSVWDHQGRIVEVQRDSMGRPTEILLGGLYALRYSYGDSSPLWTTKTLVHLRDDSVTYVWRAATHPGEIAARTHEAELRPRSAIRAFLPGHGLVAEWDPSLYPEGAAVMGFRGAPYALISLDQEGEIARSLTLVEPGAAWSFDRIDYTDNAMALHLMTDAATKETAPVTVLLTFERDRKEEHLRTQAAASTGPGEEGYP